MSARQVARRLAISRNTLKSWIASGKFPAGMKHDGHAWPRWRRSDVEAWIAGRPPIRDRLAVILERAAETCPDPRVAEWFRALAAGEATSS